MNNDLEHLKILQGKQIVDIDTEISIVVPIGSNKDEMQIEIPLGIVFSQYTLLIYNHWGITGSIPTKTNDLKGRLIVEVSIESGILALRLDNSAILKVNLNDNGYTGPEAMVLYGPGDSIIVWN